MELIPGPRFRQRAEMRALIKESEKLLRSFKEADS